jgi:putative methionine-R-sulfoxide reductase with GAF domain
MMIKPAPANPTPPGPPPVAALPETVVAAAQARNVTRMAIVLLVISILILPMYGFVAWQMQAWQLLVPGLAFALLIALSLNGIRFARNGRQDIGAGHLIGGLLFVVLVNAMFVPGIGLVLGLAGLLTTVGIAVLTVVSQRWVNRAIMIALAVSIAAGLLTIIPPPFQANVRSFQAAAPILAVVLIVAYGIFLARSFRRASLANKLIVAFLTVAIASVAVVTIAILAYVRLRFAALGSSAEIASTLSTIQQIAQLTTLVAVLIATVAALYMAQILTQPIAHLTAIAQQVRDGQLGAEAQIETSDEIGVLASTLNGMTAQLRQTLEDLELRVAERTRALETSAQIGRRLATLLDEGQIVAEVVEQLGATYNYYHAHIYLYDAAREYLVLAGGTGEVGRTLRAQGHAIARGRGLVGRAAETNTVVLVSDVGQAPGWLPNPLLPDTQSEVAVPIALGGQVLGVLDVQQNIVSGIKPADADLLQATAQQAAIALQNARSFAKAQREAQAEALIRHITQEIQSTTTAPAALQVAIRELGQALGAERVRVRLSPAGPAPDQGGAGREIQA